MSKTKDLRKLKIDFIAGTLNRGGAERQLYYMLEILSCTGIRVRVFYLTHNELHKRYIENLGISTFWVGRSPWPLVRLWNIIYAMSKCPPDIIQTTNFYTNLYAIIAAIVFRCKAICAIRGDFIREVKAIGFLGRLSLKFPQFLIANSRQAIEATSVFGVKPQSVYLLENGVDADHFKPMARRKEGTPDFPSALNLITVGQLVEGKRIDIFLQILARIYRIMPEVRGIIVGEGPLHNELKALSRELHLNSDIVRFLGAYEDMAPIYREADIFVFTSNSEGMPNVILEAMASGLPVVTARVGAVPDVVKHGVTGYVVPMNDIDGFVKYVSQLIQDPFLRHQMGESARSLAERKYSLNALKHNLFSLYEKILE